MTGTAADTSTDFALLTGLGVLVTVLFTISVLVGPEPLPYLAAVSQLFAEDPSTAALVLRELRLPRALLGIMVGATLGLSGAVLQGLLRNPLAEPGVIGVSGAAAFGAVVVFYTGLSALFPLALPIGGMTGALVAVILIYLLAGRETGILTLILAGVAISSLAGALTTLALNLAPNPYAAYEIFFWLLGSLADRSFEHVHLATGPIIAGWILLLTLGRPLDALSLGEDTAQTLGFNLATVRLRAILGTAMAVGAAVSVSGGIGFVGLVVPHILRPLVGYQPSRLLVSSALGGAVLVLAADIAVRLITTGPELKLGVVTALVGAPFFLALVVRTRRLMT